MKSKIPGIAKGIGCLLAASVIAYAQSALADGPLEPQLAFPTAEGYGKYTVGGRGGAVLEVTNLDDSGPGSLRAAVEAKGPRTVVFRVSGTIDLAKPMQINNPNITIAGQTAPGDGITLKRYPLIIGADEVIVRFIRMRLGSQSGQDHDAVSGRFQKNIILDHVSASWSVDETLSVYHNQNMTVQWSIISESLYNGHHIKGNHGFGGIWGSDYGSYHHNLIAHHSSRNPRFASGSGHTDFRNNVIYNWGAQSTYGGEMQQVGDDRFSFSTINLVANYYKPGPATEPGPVSYRIASPWSRSGASDYGKWYVAENVMEGNAAVSADNWAGGIQPQGGSEFAEGLRLAEPWPAMSIVQQAPREAFELVLANAGVTRPRRDSVDERIVEEALTGTARYEGPTYKNDHKVPDPSINIGMIDSPDDVGGWPELKSALAPLDSDHDGMPDSWELAHGLNPKMAEDRNKFGTDGYTMLEAYLNSLD